MRARRRDTLSPLDFRRSRDAAEATVEPPPATASVDAAESIVRNTGFAFAIRIMSSAFTAALTLFLVRALDPIGYGLFGLAGAIAGLLLLVADFAISQSAARFAAERRRDSWRRHA
jgi:hypothetical protein